MTNLSLDALQEACAQMAAATEFNGVLAATLQSAMTLTGADSAALALFNRTTGQWFVHSRMGEADLGEQAMQAASEGEAGQAENGLALPLKVKGKVVGAVAVGRSNPTPSPSPSVTTQLERGMAEARLVLEIFASAAALAIDSTLTKTDFVSTVTHELRLPMTSIKGYTDLIRGGMAGPVSEMQTQLLDTVRNNVDWMNSLVSDLADIAKVETGRLKVDLETVDAAACAREAVAAMQTQFDAKSQVVTVQADEPLPIRVDRKRIAQMLQYMLTNSTRYTAANGQITVKAERHSDRVRLAVSDTGVGMKPEDRAKLFNQFFRSEDQVVRDHKGWGLALHLVKRLAELFGGEVGAETEYGKGSTIWFEVPRA